VNIAVLYVAMGPKAPFLARSGLVRPIDIYPIPPAKAFSTAANRLTPIRPANHCPTSSEIHTVDGAVGIAGVSHRALLRI